LGYIGTMMESEPLVSIVISSYNYARYLREAIDSCLQQTYPEIEVIVVDDGSTDESPQILRSYGDAIRAVFKENRGHASALNLGFRLSKGHIVIFLDSDDALLPDAVEQVVELASNEAVCNVRWQMWTMDSESRVMRKRVPPDWVAEGDLKEDLLREGPHHFPPTSGNAWKREFLEIAMPIPEDIFRLGGGDLYLATLAPLYGLIKATPQPQGLYRIHTEKYTLQRPYQERLSLFLKMWDGSLSALARHARAMGIRVNVTSLKRKAWWRRVDRALRDLEQVIPPGASYILVDDDFWGTGEVLPGRLRRYLLERKGKYWGPPGDDKTAIAALEEMIGEGASFLAVVWSSYWWFGTYPAFSKYLRDHYRCLLENERVAVFNLNTAPDGVELGLREKKRRIREEGVSLGSK
jgi:glycosyltransferase involved in cell wall biosynthesis